MDGGGPRLEAGGRVVDRVRTLCVSLARVIESAPLTPKEAFEVAQEIERLRSFLRSDPHDHQLRASPAGELIVGECPQIKDVRSYVAKLARVNSTVLITGETGTGKQLVAEMIHRESPRRDRALLSVNCAALPENLLESELFGYEKGAFTGASTAKPGRIELAHGGTFFLDEIGDMNLVAQAKLLHVLESGQVERLGARHSPQLDVRFVAATNQDLESMVAQRSFRKDLYYRLNVARVHLPPLRERPDDIPLLLGHYASALGHERGLRIEGFSAEAMGRLCSYAWPGNVRELKNMIEAVLIHRPAGVLSTEELPDWCRGAAGDKGRRVEDERQRLLAALRMTNWNVSRAAESLRWSRMTLYRKMAKHRINRPPEAVVHHDASMDVTPPESM